MTLAEVEAKKAKRSPVWTPLIGAGLHLRLARRIARLSDQNYWQRSSARIQLVQLRRLLRAARGTEFGRAHDFGFLANLPDAELLSAYRSAVPVADWYAYRGAISRMREQAEPDVLWPGVVEDFAQTSGTTAGDKYIPVSRAMLRSNFLASLDIFANASRFGVGLPFITGGKSLFLGGSSALAVNNVGVRTGDLSGIVAPLIRWPISEMYLPGREIALMSSWPAKIEAMAQRTIDEDVRMISGMPSWATVLAQRLLELAKQRGITSRWPGEAGLPITCLRQLWPNLRLFVHGGVKYAPFEPRVRQIYSGSPEGDDIPTRLELYPASEGFVAIQDTPHAPGLRLNVDQFNFFEFVPLEEIDHASPRAFACHEVEKGQRYVVVLSTCAGLWRYVLGDVVEFDTIPAGLNGRGGDGPCRLRIVGRHRHFVNAFGENLIVEHIENAVAAAAKAAGVVVGEFTAAPVYPDASRRAGLELAVELAEVRQETLAVFADTFDQALKDQNVDYTTKRTQGVGMDRPTVTVLKPGAFHRWMQGRGKLGGQHKCPRCANGREILEDILRSAQGSG